MLEDKPDQNSSHDQEILDALAKDAEELKVKLKYGSDASGVTAGQSIEGTDPIIDQESTNISGVVEAVSFDSLENLIPSEDRLQDLSSQQSNTPSELSTQAAQTKDPEVLVGGSGGDAFVYDASGADLLQTGPIEDSLAYFDSSVDLSDLNVVSMDAVNLDSALDNFLNVSVADVERLSEDGHLTISRETTEGVNLQGEWIQGESTDGYTTYISGDVSVSIDDAIVDAGGVFII